LRKFIDTCFTHKPSNIGHPFIIFTNLMKICLRIDSHRSKLIAIKFLIIQSIAKLTEKNRTFRTHFDQYSQKSGQPGKNKNNYKYGQQNIKCSFCKFINGFINRNITEREYG